MSGKSAYDAVNVFHGTGKSVDLSKGEMSYKWNAFKGKAGNTSPAACLPFGNVSCAPYSGGYPTGYGNFKLNSGEPVETFFDGNKLIGFSHFTQSGVGGIKVYYNYLVTTPFLSDFSSCNQLKDFDMEEARPGYYSCRIKQDNIRAELTVENGVAIHRYTALDKQPLKIAVDISNNGLCQPWEKKVFDFSQKSQMQIDENGCVGGYVIMHGVKLYYYVGVPKETTAVLWKGKSMKKKAEVTLKRTKKRFGCVLNTHADMVVLKIGYSLIDMQSAKRAAEKASGFDDAVQKAKHAWEQRLSTIELFDVSEKQREIFYSNYYHTLVKPGSWEKESFLWDEKETFYFDFATLWDIYKTQTPLLFALHGDIGKGIVKTLLRFGKERGKLFNTLLLSTNMNIEAQQACCLGCYVLYDAYIRGLVDTADVAEMMVVVRAELEPFRKAVITDTMEKTTHLLDVTLIASAFEKVAKDLNMPDDESFFAELAQYWTNAFAENGLLKESALYYEGNRWNYSFRFVSDVQKRILLSGGETELLHQLDAFFAFNDDNTMEDRFEGFNNETDMETPYFYAYIGRYDRLQRLMEECANVCFQDGREAFPGNNDSGGLSACYIWNVLGLFPITGQDKMFIGRPIVSKAILHLYNGNKLQISQEGTGDVVKVLFNGNEVKDYYISVLDIMQGGALRFVKENV